MKLLTFAPSLRACLLATLVFHTLTTESSEPMARIRLHILPPRFTMNEVIRAVSRKYQVKTAFVKSIIAAESGFSPGIVSPKGAVGLMQLMPATAREFGADPAVPEQNVEAGTHYLSWLMQRYANRRDQLPRTIAAYNAGPGAVERYRGVPPYRETRKYVSRVLRFFKKYQTDELRGLG
jgi:soluble lytic murein transglycosylase-like protein